MSPLEGIMGTGFDPGRPGIKNLPVIPYQSSSSQSSSQPRERPSPS